MVRNRSRETFSGPVSMKLTIEYESHMKLDSKIFPVLNLF